MVKYPQGPPPAGNELSPGEGVNAKPFDAEEYLDFTTPLGKATGVYYGLMFQLGKWGFQTFKIKESIFVSPSFKPYYEITIGEKTKLENQIKSSLASIAQSVADLELLLHDLRKYRQYMEYFEKIKEGEKLIKEGKKEEGEKIKREAEQTLRSIFIDNVDAHTDLPNAPVALRSIASRWPTIISDFMKLDKEKTPEEIKLDVSQAEKIILATKNKLFLQWKSMFEQTVKDRYRRIRELVESKKRSIEEYKKSLKPTVARYKMINEFLSTPTGRAIMFSSFFHPEAQALSVDAMTIWAWKPFAPEEKYRASARYQKEITLSRAGFLPNEIKELTSLGIPIKVKSLPVEPSIDSVVRRMIPQIEKEYNVKLTARDLYEARERLLKAYKTYESGIGTGEPWVFSPYFTFLEIPMRRTVLKLPDGTQIENLSFKNLVAYTETQNIIISRLLEIIAREKRLEYEISSLMGELGIKGNYPMSLDELLKEDFPNIYGPKKEESKIEVKVTQKSPIYKLVPGFFRAKGPYEFSMSDRLAKYYQIPTGKTFAQIKMYLMASFEVPGVSMKVLT